MEFLDISLIIEVMEWMSMGYLIDGLWKWVLALGYDY